MDWQSLAALACSVGALGISLDNLRYTRRRHASTDWQNAVEEIRKALYELDADHRVTKKQISLFWGIVEREISNMLHSPHRAELDRLIEKNMHDTLEPTELKRFTDLLQELAEDKGVSHGEQAAALLLKAVVVARHHHVYH